MLLTSPHPASPRLREFLTFGLGLLIASASWPTTAVSQAAPAGAAGAAGSRPASEALNFANGLLRERHYAQAAEEYERLLKDGRPGPEAAEAHFGLANARLFLGQNKEARRHFEEFLRMAPDHPGAATALYRVGETSYMLVDLPAARKALEAFTSGQARHKHLETAWPYLGDVYFRLKDLPKARQAYQQALAAFPEGVLADRARYGLGRTLAAQDDPKAALETFSDLVDREVRDWADLARFQIGQLQAKAGRYAEAIAAYEALERAAPGSPLIPEARLRRAEALAHLGRHDEAEGLLRPLMAEASQALAAQVAYTLGVSLLERGRAAEARATLDEALKRSPGSPMAPALLFRSAEASQKEGRSDVARARYLKVLEIAPDDPWADDALLRAAGLALEASDLAAARSLAGSLATRYPNSPLVAEAHLVEARAALAAGQAKRAIQLLDGLLARDKPGAEVAQTARYYLGQAYRADGQAEKAIEVHRTLAETPAAPAATDAQFLVGQGHFHAGRFAESIGPLEAYLAAKPRGEVADHALAYLAAARQELGRAEEARAALDQLASRFPASKTLAPTRLRLADAALAAEQADRSAELYRLVAESDAPALRVRALSGLGWSLLQGGKAAEAAAAFAARLEAASDDPTAPEDALALGRALEAADRVDEALAAYARVAERHARSEPAGPAMLARARLLAKAGRPEEAADAFAGYLRDHPKGGGRGDTPDAVLSEWGWALLDAKKPDEADRIFNRLLAEFADSPRAAEARLNLAESAYQAKNYEEVARLLEPLVADGSGADPVLIQSALYRLGRTCVRRKDWPGAARMFDRLIAADPSGPFRREARFWKAEVAFQGNDIKAAEVEFAALVDEPPAADGAEDEDWIRTARLRRVQSLVLLERWADALARADALKAEAPDHPQGAEIDYARGRALMGLARYDEARPAFQAVIEARKGSELAAQAQLMRGETYFHQRNYDEARRELLMVYVLYDAPSYRKWQATALLEVGKVYEQLARWTDAAEAYKKLRERFPDDPNAIEAARRLDEVRRQAAAASEAERTR